MNNDTIKEICEYIIDNINENISIDDLSERFYYNKFYIIRKFKECTGFTIGEFINTCRVYNSIDPLVFSKDTILKIALNNGFNSLEYYSEKFKEVIGISPVNFRKIFEGIIYIYENTDEMDELEYVKDVLNDLIEYQGYLNSIGAQIESNDNTNCFKEEAKVRVIALSNNSLRKVA